MPDQDARPVHNQAGERVGEQPIMFTRRNRANHTKPWDADDIDQLAALIFARKTIPQIAEALGRSQEAVRTKANDLDFLPKRARRKSVSTSGMFA